MVVNEHMVPRRAAKNRDLARVQMVQAIVAVPEVMTEVATDREENLTARKLQSVHTTEAKAVQVGRKRQDHSTKNQKEHMHPETIDEHRVMMMRQNVHITEVKEVVIVQDQHDHLAMNQDVHQEKEALNVLVQAKTLKKDHTTEAEVLAVVRKHQDHSMKNRNVHTLDVMIQKHQETTDEHRVEKFHSVIVHELRDHSKIVRNVRM